MGSNAIITKEFHTQTNPHINAKADTTTLQDKNEKEKHDNERNTKNTPRLTCLTKEYHTQTKPHINAKADTATQQDKNEKEKHDNERNTKNTPRPTCYK